MSESADIQSQSAAAAAAPQPKPKRSPAKRRRQIRRAIKGVTWVLILCALAAGGWWYYNTTRDKGAESDTVQYLRAPVRQGPFDVYVYGSGSIAAASQPVVYMQTEGKLIDLRVSVGDQVSKGQILAALQNDPLNDEIASLEFDLWNADHTLTTTPPGSGVSSIQAPSAGRVMEISAGPGDDALAVYRRFGSVAMLSTDGRMKVAIEVASGLSLTYGETVSVSGAGFSLDGCVTDLFLQDSQAVITVVDDTLPLGAPVTVTAGGAAAGQGNLEINKPMAVSAFGGTIGAVRVQVGDTVSRRQEMFVLEDSPITLTVENLRIQREAAAKALQEARDRRENLIVRAPVDGVVATVEIAEGAEAAAGDALCSVLEGEDMVLTIAVDELDVVKVAEGQRVAISVDALPELVLAGEVQKIAPVGVSTSGVSTYDVMLSFDSAGTGVRPGMNASGQVQVAHADSALFVPVEALMTMNDQKYLLVADGGAGAAAGGPWDPAAGREGFQRSQGDAQRIQDNAQQGQGSAQRIQDNTQRAQDIAPRTQGSAQQGQGNFQRGQEPPQNGASTSGQEADVAASLRAVTVGLVNDDYAEILTGVNPGEIVLYQYSRSGNSPNSQYMRFNTGIQMPLMGF